MALVTGKAIIFGIRPVKPIVNIPPDALKVRIRMRAGSCANAFIKFADRVECWLIGPSGNVLSSETWVLLHKEGVNV